MKTAVFQGNHYEIGRQQGVAFHKNPTKSHVDPFDRQLYHKQLDVYKEYYPECLEELKGMAHGAGFNPEQLIYRFICGEILFYTEMLNLRKEKRILARSKTTKAVDYL